MTQWEYKYYNSMPLNSAQDELNALGLFGWELVSFSERNGYMTAVFKRPIETAKKQKTK